MMPTDDRDIVFFDIDNTLYSASTKVSQAMGQRIHAYFVSMGFPDEEATELHHRYYSTYGLALRGLTHHHEIDPLDFDAKCDGALPLEDVLRSNPEHRKLFQDIDRSKYRVWGLTNAYKTHARRVLSILKLDDLVDDIVYCDYAVPEFSCKPEAAYYRDALKKANVTDPSKCYFIDDSCMNVEAAHKLGWGHCVHFVEQGLEAVEGGKMKKIGSDQSQLEGVNVVSQLEELRNVWPEIFKSHA